jgi:uncharacterized protein (DUF433 family)
MAALDWSQCAAVESVLGKLGGAWVLRGTRLPVATVFENLEDLSIGEVMEQFDLTREEIRRCSNSPPAARRRGPSYFLLRRLTLVLFDHCTPRGIARYLVGHTMKRARRLGWAELLNGAFSKAAEEGSGEQWNSEPT